MDLATSTATPRDVRLARRAPAPAAPSCAVASELVATWPRAARVNR